MENHRLTGGGQHPAADGEEPAQLSDSRDEIAGDVGQCGQNQIAQAMPGEPFPAAEAVPHNLRHQRLNIRHCCQHVADVPRRRHLQLTAQNAGASAVIRHGDDRCNIKRLLLEPPQHYGESGSPPMTTILGRTPCSSATIIPSLIHAGHVRNPDG